MVSTLSSLVRILAENSGKVSNETVKLKCGRRRSRICVAQALTRQEINRH